MPLPDLRALFNLPPERAVAYLEAKGLQLTGPYWELDGPEHSRVFTVANLAKLDVLADIREAVQGALEGGQTERWFRAQLIDVLRKKGWWGPAVQVDPDTGEARIVQQGSLRRLQTIYRTNLQSAYMAGRHRQALEQADRAPFAQYLAVRDSRTRPSHAALHGKVFRLDSPEWSVISPPSGYSCRCRARYMSQDELDERGLKLAEDVRILERMPQRPVGDVLTGEAPARVIERGVSVADTQGENSRAILWADRGWDHLPGGTGAERRLIDRMMVRADELSDGIRAVVLADLARRGADFARAASAAPRAKQTVYIQAPGVPELAEQARAQAPDLDLSGLALGLDHDRVRHIIGAHGSARTEAPRGQRAVSAEDFARLPAVLAQARGVGPGTPPTAPSGARLVEVVAEVDGETWVVVLELRPKQGLMVPYTLWIRPN